MKGILPYSTGGLPAFGYNGDGGRGIYAFNQGNLGIGLHGSVFGGTVFGGPGNPNGASYHGRPVLGILSLSGSAQDPQDASLSLAWIAPNISIDDVAESAMDTAAVWAKANQKEVGSLIDSSGRSVEGLPEQRTDITNYAGTPTANTPACWHLHLPLPNRPIYQFSDNVGPRSDAAFMHAYPTLIYYLGVLEASPGRFTILKQMPGQTLSTLIRGDPWSHLPPGG